MTLDRGLLYLLVQPATGEVRYVNAGGCLPLLLEHGVPFGRFVDSAAGAPLDAQAEADRRKGTLVLTADSTLLLYTDGLVESRSVPGLPAWSGSGSPPPRRPPGWTTSVSTCSERVPASFDAMTTSAFSVSACSPARSEFRPRRRQLSFDRTPVR